MDSEVNHKNSRVIAYNSFDIPPMFQTKNPGFIMVFDAAANDGSVMNLYFLAVGSKIGTKKYLDILKTSLLSWMEQNFGFDNVLLIWDSAPSHTSKATLAFFWWGLTSSKERPWSQYSWLLFAGHASSKDYCFTKLNHQEFEDVHCVCNMQNQKGGYCCRCNTCKMYLECS